MPVTNYVQGNLLNSIRDRLMNATTDWPADPRNIYEGYRQLLTSKTPGADYLNAAQAIGNNMVRDTDSYLQRVNSGDPNAMMNLILMMKNPMSAQGIGDRVRERIMMNKAMGRGGADLVKGIPEQQLRITEQQVAAQRAAQGVGQAEAQAAPSLDAQLRELLNKDYATLTDKERGFVNGALSPEDFKALLAALGGGGAAYGAAQQ